MTKAREATESVVGENATIVSALGSYVEETANIMLGFGEPFNKFITAMQSVGDEALATVTVSFVGDNSSFEKIYSVKADSSALTLSVESVSLDQSNVVI